MINNEAKRLAEQIAMGCGHGWSGYKKACVDCIAAALTKAINKAYEHAATIVEDDSYNIWKPVYNRIDQVDCCDLYSTTNNITAAIRKEIK